MKANLATTKKLESSFLSCEKDYEAILKKLFIENQPHSDELKRLLIINTNDCLDKSNANYQNLLKKYDLATLKEKGYVTFKLKNKLSEHEEVKSYIAMTTSNYMPNSSNPHFRDCTLNFDIVCHSDYWDLKDYQVRPLKIAGYIDGIINNTKLSGIGTLQFLGCKILLLDGAFSGYTLIYEAVHGNDDKIDIE